MDPKVDQAKLFCETPFHWEKAVAMTSAFGGSRREFEVIFGLGAPENQAPGHSLGSSQHHSFFPVPIQKNQQKRQISLGFWPEGSLIRPLSKLGLRQRHKIRGVEGR